MFLVLIVVVWWRSGIEFDRKDLNELYAQVADGLTQWGFENDQHVDYRSAFLSIRTYYSFWKGFGLLLDLL